MYQRGDDQTRRLCNQAFFTKLYLGEDNEVRADLARPLASCSTPTCTTAPGPGPTILPPTPAASAPANRFRWYQV
jgi:hypothetical protein